MARGKWRCGRARTEEMECERGWFKERVSKGDG